MTSEIRSFNIVEVLYVFLKLLLVFLRLNLCTLFILFRFNSLTMVLFCPFIGLFLRFPAIATQAIISCEPSLRGFIFKLRTYDL